MTVISSYHFGIGFITLTFYLNPYWLKVMMLTMLLPLLLMHWPSSLLINR